jgi:hypothetical protein
MIVPFAPFVPFYLNNRLDLLAFKTDVTIDKINYEINKILKIQRVIVSKYYIDETIYIDDSICTRWICLSVAGADFEIRLFDCNDSKNHIIEPRLFIGCRLDFMKIVNLLKTNIESKINYNET